MAGLILFCLFLFIPLSKQHAIQESLDKVVSSLGSIIDFFQHDYKNLNVDGLFGLRILEGQFEGLLLKHENAELQHVNQDIIGRIRDLKNKTTHVCKAAIQEVKSDDLEYFQKMSFIVGSPWSIFDSKRKRVDPSKIWSDLAYQYAKTKKVKVDETTSDKCMSELMGSHKPLGEPCDISDACAHIMTHPGILGYGITHQILWTMLAEKAGCKNHLEARLNNLQRGTTASVRLELCTNNYVQIVDTLNKLGGVVLPPLQDLFLEELFVCPSLGFYEFLDISYLPQIFSWQHSSGCYGKLPFTSRDKVAGIDKSLMGKFDYHDENNNNVKFNHAEGIDLQNVIDGLSASKKGTLKQFHNGNKAVEMGKPGLAGNKEAYKSPVVKGRRLLIEKEMSDGCLSHKTAVASGALIMYLRYLCEPDAALIFNRSRSVRSIKSVEPDRPQKPVQNLVQDHVVKTGDSVINSPKVVGNVASFNKQPLTFDDKKGFVNESLDELEGARVQDGGKKFIHGDEIGNQQFAFNRQQIHPPDIQGNLNRLHMNKDIETQLGNDDDDNDDGGDDELDEEDEDEDDDDEYDYANNDGKGNREDGYEYDNENGKLAGDNDEEGEEDNDYDEAPIDPNQHPVVLKPDQYQNNDDGDDLDDNYNADDDDDEDDEDYDGDYTDNKVNEIAHPHINARNLGQNKNKNYDHAAVYDQYEKSINHDKDYYDDDDDGDDDDDDDDDEKEDDYEYDDENDNVEIKRPEDEKQQFEIVGTEKQSQKIQEKQSHTHSHISKDSVPPKTVFIVFLLCFSVVLLLMYRFIRKRRIRIRFNPKYFHV